MCSFYSITTNKPRSETCSRSRGIGNLPPLPVIFPDQIAPVVRVNEGERELTMMRWGMPNPPQLPGITPPSRPDVEDMQPSLPL
jgi:putative SOS response-associated peptidase YedK